MGLFDKKKINNISEVSPSMLEEGADNARFTLVAQSATEMLDGNGVVVSGVLNGHASSDSKVYIINIGNQVTEAKLVKVEGKDAEGSLVQDAVSDCEAQLQLEADTTLVIRKFAVITNIRPQLQIDEGQAVENPLVSGLLYDLQTLKAENAYFGTLVYALTHSHYITPIHFNQEPVKEPDGREVFKEETQMGFYMLNPPANFPLKEGQKFVLPVYTDWTELRKFTPLAKSEKKVRTMILTFQNILELIKRPDCGGFVINPFSKNTLTVGDEMLKLIMNCEGYKKEFGQGAEAGESDISEQVTKKQTQFAVGAPKETDEIKNIKSELATYGKLHEEIKQISLLLKIGEDKTQRYLIVLDVEQDEAKAHMQGIYDAIKGYASTVSAVEFSIKGMNKGIDDVALKLVDSTLVYLSQNCPSV